MSPRSFRVRGGLWLVAPALLVVPALPAADTPGPEPRVEAGKNQSAAGALLARATGGGTWHAVEPGAAVFSRDVLLALPGSRAVVEPRPDSVGLTLWGNLPQLSSFPGLESAVVLHDSRAYDLDFSLLRGRVVVSSAKAKGPARVWVRLPGTAWELTLAERGDAIALESYGRWPRGVPFTKEPRPGERPTTAVVATVLKGRVELATDDTRYTLTAPPGPASFRWDSVAGADAGPERRDQLPPWADLKAPRPPEAAAVEQVVGAFQAGLKGRAPGAALSELLDAADRETDKARAALVREFAILSLAAVDELPRVAQALADPKHASARDTATVALRHWIGESSGRDPVLYFVLTQQLNYSEANAETVLQLLHSPFRADEPDGLRALLAYLRHDRLAVRSLALWHLRRLVPAGKDIAFDPAAPEADREKGYAEWKKLIASRSADKGQG